MSPVFIVEYNPSQHDGGEPTSVLGVFSTLKKAEEFVKTSRIVRIAFNHGIFKPICYILKYKIDDPEYISGQPTQGMQCGYLMKAYENNHGMDSVPYEVDYGASSSEEEEEEEEEDIDE